MKSYVDPELPKVGYNDLLARQECRPVQLAVEFQRNGEAKSSVSRHVQEKVGNSQTLDRLQLVLNNVADTGGAVGQGVKTGLPTDLRTCDR